MSYNMEGLRQPSNLWTHVSYTIEGSRQPSNLWTHMSRNMEGSCQPSNLWTHVSYDKEGSRQPSNRRTHVSYNMEDPAPSSTPRLPQLRSHKLPFCPPWCGSVWTGGEHDDRSLNQRFNEKCSLPQLIAAGIISRWERAPLVLLKGFVGNPWVFHSVARLYLVRRTGRPLFGLFAWNIIFSALIGWRCSDNWQAGARYGSFVGGPFPSILSNSLQWIVQDLLSYWILNAQWTVKVM